MKQKAEPPLHVAWEVTRHCNAQCLHCSSASGPESQGVEPDTSQALQIIDQLAEAGVRVLAFSGGEPLLRADLPSLVHHAIARGLTTNICTNGSLVDDKMALRLKEVNRSRLRKDPQGPRSERTREAAVRPQPRRDAGRAMAPARELSPLARLIHALREEKVRFQIVGMSGAILQGVPATTLDTDIWIDLPARQYYEGNKPLPAPWRDGAVQHRR